MKTPLFSAALGMAAAYYLCSGFADSPAVSALCMLTAGVLASAAIAVSGFPARQKRFGGFPAQVLLFSAAAGVFSGVLVCRYSAAVRASAYFGFVAKDCAVFSCAARGDSRISKNGNLLTPVQIEAVWDARGNRAGASAAALALFRDGAFHPAAVSPGSPPVPPAAARVFQGEKLRLSGSLSRGNDGEFFLIAGAAAAEGDFLPFFAARKNLFLKIEALITSFGTRPFRSRWPGLFTALTLGNQEYLDSALAESFRQAGAVHVLALSGMHLGLLAFFARAGLGFFLRGRAADALVLILVVSYLWLAGARPSLVRAALMFAGAAVFSLMGRKPGMLVLLAFSFIASALAFPRELSSLSFILSYLAMLGLLLGTIPAARFLMRWTPRLLASPLAVSLSAQAAVSPVLFAIFGCVSPGGIPASLALGPLVTLFMGTGIAACVSAALPSPLSYPLSWIADLAMRNLYAAITFTVEICARIPPLPP